MALAIAEANAVSSRYYDKHLTEQAYDEHVLWTKMKNNNLVKVKGGADLSWPIRYRRLDKADAIGAREQLSFEQYETRALPKLDWVYYYANALISWDERVKNAGKQKVVDLLADKATEMQQDMFYRFATDLWTSNPNGLGIVPLSTIVATGTYGDIDDADATTWYSPWNEGTATILTLYGSTSVSKMINTCTLGSNRPDFHITTRDLYSKFMSLYEGHKVINDNKLAEAGFDNCKFLGATIAPDSFTPVSNWYGLDINQYEFWVHNDFNFKLNDWFELEQAGFPNAMARVMTVALNLVCRMRKTSGKFTTLNYAS
jgi:hypothetical protein